MKQNLLNKLWLRVCMMVAIMTTALAASADVKTINAGALTNGVLTDSPFTLTFAKNSGSTEPTYNSNGGDVRLYAKGTVTVASAGGNMTKIVFNLSAQGKKRLAPITASVGTIATQSSGDETVTWTGDAASVTFTVGDKADYGSDGSSKAGQLCFSSVDITYTAGGTPTVATPVINGTENFLTSAEVSISCATDGATILYNTGGEAWETYSAPFTVTETTTVKAKATKTSMDDSEVATKTFTKVTALTVAEARAAIDAGTGTQGVYATGIVSAIPTAYNASHKNITFNFVDAAGDTDFLQAYRCGGDEAADVQVGDVVVVYGNLTKYGTTYEFAANCQLVSLTHPTAAVEAPIFSPEGGVFTTPQSVSFAVAAPTMEGYTFYYTLDGTEPTTQSTLYTGPIEVSTTTTIKAIAVKGGEVSLVTTATYAILAHAGTEADPYSVADAHAAIDANAGLTDVYATGVVTEIATAWNTEHSNISFNFVDATGDEVFLQAYRCKGTDAADASTVQVGDIVVVKGNLTKYNTTYEFGQGCELVSLTHSGTPADPVIVAENATIDAGVTYYELMYEIQNPVDGTELTASTTASWITSCTPSQKSFDRVMIVCEANETTTARTATIVLTYGTLTKEVTLTQKGIVAPITQFASLPFSFDGGKADIETTDGLTQEGLGTDYKNSPYLKLDGTGDYVLLAFNERPGILTFDIIGNGFSDGTFKVQASVDGTTYSDVATYTELGSKETKTISDLGEDVRYIKWVYTEKVTGNVALGNINLAKYGTVVLNDYTLTVANPANVTITASYGQDVLTNGETAEVTEGTDVTVALTIVSGYDLQSVTVNGTDDGQAVTLSPGTTEGVYTFTMPAFNVTVNATAVEHIEPVTTSYVLATTITSGKTYVIASGADEGEVQVMAEQRTNNRGAVTATITNGILNVSDEYEFVIETANIGEASGYSIFDPDAKGYLYAAASGSNHLKTQTDNNVNGVWTITIDATAGEASVVAASSSNRNVMQYNSGSTLFSCYATASQSPVYLFEKVENFVPTVQTVTVTDAGYATFIAEKNLEIPTDVQVEVFAVTVEGSYASLQPIVGNIPAGEAVLVKASAGDYNFLSAQTADPIKVNKLVAATTDVVADGTQYVLANGPSGIGFYQATPGSTIPAGKAYLVVTAAGVKPFYGFEDDATGIEMVNGQSSMVNDPIFNLAGQRLQKMQRGINIIGGKKILK
jgi:hypothetical protein